MSFHIMYAESSVGDYARPGLEADSLIEGCRKSRFQFLDRKPLECGLSDAGGFDFPDLIMHAGCVPLISEKMRQLLDSNGVDNLFYKPVFIKDESLGLRQPLWLALPPRIDCLNMDACKAENCEAEYGVAGRGLARLTQIAIDPAKIGNYQIFRLPEAYENQEIIVTDRLRSILEGAGLVNVHFQEL